MAEVPKLAESPADEIGKTKVNRPLGVPIFLILSVAIAMAAPEVGWFILSAIMAGVTVRLFLYLGTNCIRCDLLP